ALQVSGSATIDLAGLLSVEGSFVLTQFEIAAADVAPFGAGATGLALVWQIGVEVPVGGVSGSGTLELVRISNLAGQTWMAAEATALEFVLAFGPVTLEVTNGSLVLNQAPLGSQRLDWATVTVPASTQVALTAALFNGDIALQVSGS